MPTYILVECGSDRVLGVTHAAGPITACVELSRRSNSPTPRLLYEIRSNPRDRDWLAYELPEPFDDPITWEIFGLDAVKHGQLTTVVARRTTK